MLLEAADCRQMSGGKLLILIKAAHGDSAVSAGIENQLVSNFQMKLITFEDLQTTTAEIFHGCYPWKIKKHETVQKIAF